MKPEPSQPTRSWWLDFPTRDGFAAAAIRESMRMSIEKPVYAIDRQKPETGHARPDPTV